MPFKSDWHTTATPFTDAVSGPVHGSYDVAVNGGGFAELAVAGQLNGNAWRPAFGREF